MFFFLNFFLSYYKGYSLHDYKLKNTGAHNPDANFKTHVQRKQVYVGLVVKQALELLAPSSL